MTEDRDALLQHYKGTRAKLLAALDGISDDLMIETSLDGWSIKDHLAHVSLWDEIRAGEVIRISSGHDSAWRMSGEQDGSYNELGYSLRQSLSLTQIRWELTISRAKLIQAISSATPRGLDPSLYGEAGLKTFHESEHLTWIKRWRAEKGI